MWQSILDFLAEYHTKITISIIFFCGGIVIITLMLLLLSTERRLWRATRAEIILDHRHSTPTTVDLIVINPIKMKGYKALFFDPYEFNLTYGQQEERFDIKYIGRLGDNFKFRISGLEPATVYTDVKAVMGEKFKLSQSIVNIWTRDKDDNIIKISDATPADKTIERVLEKSTNAVQNKVNKEYFDYAVHYGNSRNRWTEQTGEFLHKHGAGGKQTLTTEKNVNILDKKNKTKVVKSNDSKESESKKTTKAKTSTSNAKNSTTTKKTNTTKKTTTTKSSTVKKSK